MEMELNTRYTLATEKGVIDPEGVGAIIRLINAQRLHREEWGLSDAFPAYLPPLPADFDWVWMTGAGSFPKRVSKHYYQTIGVKLPAWFKSQLGNIAKSHSTREFVYRFDFVNRFNWIDGDFGDSGSCYWGSNASAREMLEDNDALAMRFFHDDGRGRGWAWLVEVDDAYIVFNGYGFPHATFTIARVLAKFCGLSYKEIGLVNNCSAAGVLYINGGKGYVVADRETIKDFPGRYDFGWDEPYVAYCESCNEPLHEDDVHFCPDGYPYCEHCFYDLFDTCARCGEAVYHEDSTVVDCEPVCDYCLQRHYHYCEACGEYYRRIHICEVATPKK
jgi:hypothetical protein